MSLRNWLGSLVVTVMRLPIAPGLPDGRDENPAKVLEK
jgi:hypothetical protein